MNPFTLIFFIKWLHYYNKLNKWTQSTCAIKKIDVQQMQHSHLKSTKRGAIKSISIKLGDFNLD